ncbi:hypothetical protein AVEN_55440-1 [Araneus ventricosus]|uniref:Reverse transcriptase/retrotransposon-derived protein RNase H-like domain-containing protein n=1 Tax=Araneus ventricosus TaxID=182803 RepID=A0A4Y2B3Y2_ARAVE|nr:hypothetical protein AVEN_55440-1 [Araneus ventricosus]
MGGLIPTQDCIRNLQLPVGTVLKSDIARPLSNLTKKNIVWKWSEQEQQAFQTLKQRLVTPPVLIKLILLSLLSSERMQVVTLKAQFFYRETAPPMKDQ